MSSSGRPPGNRASTFVPWTESRDSCIFREEVAQMRYGMIAAIAAVALSASPARAQDAKAKGEKIFTDQKCSLCHSIGGHGNAKGPLDTVGSKLSADEIRQWITDAKAMTAKAKATRKPEMKQYTLPKEDVDSLVAFLQAQKGK
jgi:mono/diheme cytochrome c family protein